MTIRIPALHSAVLVSALLFCYPASAAATTGIAADIQTLAENAAHAPKAAPRPYDERNWLQRFYGPRAYAPVWNPAQSAAAQALLKDAATHGLVAAEYSAELPASQANSAAAADVAMTVAMLHYLADLRVGRVRSEYHSAPPDPRLTAFDPVEQLRGALAANKLAEAVEAAQPRFPTYKRIKTVLATYRKLAQEPQLDLPPLPNGRKLEPGSPYAGAQALYVRLTLLGDLAPDAPAGADGVYGPELVDAVKSFQTRHGLDGDGIIGRGTLAALNVPLSVRVRQLELTLERLRWLPDFTAGRVIAVNLPTYRLWAFEVGGAAPKAPLEMKVIVGAAVKTETPLFVGSMRYLEFNPYWNVPRSIEKGELIAKMEKDPNYLTKNDMEMVPLEGGGAPVTAVDAATLDGLRNARYRVRQRPGPQNALGAVKFALPNPDNIYLHSTSARELFKRTRRDLSHGCIRVEDPQGLAQFVLSDQPQWTAESIKAAMAPGTTRTVSLKTPIPVVLFYATAVTDRGGRVLFPEDVYKRDPLLEKALKARRAGVVAAN